MRPDIAAQLAPGYMLDRDLAESLPHNQLNLAARQLDAMTTTYGYPVDSTYAYEEIAAYLGLPADGNPDPRLRSQILPVHDQQPTADGDLLFSRFLVVDAPNPQMHERDTIEEFLRGYFLLLIREADLQEPHAIPEDPATFFPLYAVSEFSRQENTSEPPIHGGTWLFRGSPAENWPISTAIRPRRLEGDGSDSRGYFAFAEEMRLAVENIAIS